MKKYGTIELDEILKKGGHSMIPIDSFPTYMHFIIVFIRDQYIILTKKFP